MFGVDTNGFHGYKQVSQNTQFDQSVLNYLHPSSVGDCRKCEKATVMRLPFCDYSR